MQATEKTLFCLLIYFCLIVAEPRTYFIHTNFIFWAQPVLRFLNIERNQISHLGQQQPLLVGFARQHNIFYSFIEITTVFSYI